MFIGSSISLNTMMLGTRFTPASLFANGEQGFWLDPSDVANLDWRRNLLLWTQEFENAVWTKEATAATENVAVAPDGTATAELLAETSATAAHAISQTVSSLSSTQHVFSVYLKKGSGATAPDWVQLTFGGASTGYANFNLSTGVVGIATTATATISNVGSGWYRCSLIVTVATAGAASGQVVFTNNTDSATRRPSYAGATTSDVLLWGAQLELGSVATQYQAITTVEAGTLERFPQATMYVDRAGSTLVTTPGQLVGLRLDKSKQLAIGPELIANGNFSNGSTGWTITAPGTNTITISGGAVRFVTNGSADTATLYQPWSGATAVGKTYRITFDVLPGSTGLLKITTLGVNSTIGEQTFTATPGAKSFTLISSNVSTIGIARVVSASADATIDNISVREIAGNHATAISDATRGTYGIEPFGGRRNLFGWSEDLTNGIWTKTAGVTVTATQATFTTGGGAEVVRQFQSLLSGQAYTVSFSARSVSGNTTLSVDLENVETQSFTLTATNQRFSWTVTPAAARAWVDFQLGAAGVIVLTDIQLERSTLTPYQRVTDQWNVTEAGVPTVHYLQYDSDAYVTPTIDPSLNPPPGPEIIVNGDFSSSTDWTLGAGWTIGRGVASFDGTNAPNTIFQSSAILASGASYQVKITVSMSQGELIVRPNVNASAGQFNIQSSGTYTFVLVGSAGSFGCVAGNFGGRFTGSIDNISVRELVTDEVQVFAGVRKLSDAATGLLLESSTSVFSFPGSINLLAPSGAFPNYQFSSGGTVLSGAVATPYAAPISNVLTSLGDISADRATIRINGAQVAQSTADQGTGSYGAYPFYIGARGGSSLFFSGRDYGIITRFGPNLTNTTILDTEEWLGNKTGVLYVLWNGVWQDQYTWVDNLNWNDGV